MPGPSYLDLPLGAATESWFEPMGLALRLVTDSPEVRTAAEEAFRGFGPGPASDPKADCTLRLFAHEVEDEVPLRTVMRVDGRLVYQTAGRGSTLVVDRQEGVGFGYLSPAVLADRVFFRWHFLDLALFFFLEGRGFLGVHGAALARGGKALLLRARSGAGKSTLVYAASRRSFRALAEDLVWLAPDGATVWGMPWTFHLLPDAAGLFPELATAAEVRRHVQHNGEDKLAVDLERMRPGSTAPSAELAGLVFLRREPGGGSRLDPVGPGEAWEEWLAGAASRERSAQQDYDRRTGDLVRALPAYRLTLGDDLEAALDLLEPLLP